MPTEEAPPPSQKGAPRAATVHGAHGDRVERVIDYLGFVARPLPLGVMLDEAPRRIADILGAEVVSLYLLEGDGKHLTMRGNVGFPLGARGTVRLRVGEGITGLAVESLRPISAAWAPQHERYRAFPELDEERYPVFLAVPVLGSANASSEGNDSEVVPVTRALGALVVQRQAERPFREDEVSLVAALTAPIASAIRLARLLDELRERAQRRTGSGTRRVTLPGVPLVRGRALGAIAALRRPASRPRAQAEEGDRERLKDAIESMEKALRTLIARAAERGFGERGRFLEDYQLMLKDRVLIDRAGELMKEGMSLPATMGEVARHALRAAERSGEPFLIERARGMEELCDALLMTASPDEQATLPSKAILVAERITIYDLLISARYQPAAIALTDPEPSAQTRALLELLGVPTISDVQNAFRWIGPADVALLDADHGFLTVNPSRAEVAAFRVERKRDRLSQP